MHYRRLGRTELKVSEIGYGTNMLGRQELDESEHIAMVHRAMELGINCVDTADVYQEGRSEVILGKALKGRRDRMILATKVGSVIPREGRDISPGHIEEAVEASLRRLQTDYIDVYQLHSPQLHHLQENNWLETMQSLKEQGKIRYWGASVNHIDAGVWLLEQDLIDSLQPTFHMLYHDMADAMFGLVAERDVGVVVKQGLARGLVSGKYAADAFTGSGWHEQGAVVDAQVILRKVEELRFLERAGRSQAQAALQYLLSYPVVSTIIAGAKQIEQLEMNAGASNGTGLVGEELERVKAVLGRDGDQTR